MSQFALIENNIVVNLIDADDINIMALVFPDAELVLEVTESTGPAHIGAEVRNSKFVTIQPYLSWTWDEKRWAWIAPKKYPSTVTPGSIVVWNEDTLDWLEIAPVATEAIQQEEEPTV